MLEVKTDGWHGGNAVWTTYECNECDNEVHTTTRDPEPSCCPYCGTDADGVECAKCGEVELPPDFGDLSEPVCESCRREIAGHG